MIDMCVLTQMEGHTSDRDYTRNNTPNNCFCALMEDAAWHNDTKGNQKTILIIRLKPSLRLYYELHR